MRRYRSSSFRRRRTQRKWAYLILLVSIIFTMRYFVRNSIPTSAFGGVDDTISKVGIKTENRGVLSAPELISDPKLYEIPDLFCESNSELSAIKNVMACVETDPLRIIEARTKLNEMLLIPMNEQQLAFAKKQLSKLSKEWLFSKAVFLDDELCARYKVKPADRLEVLGKRFNVPYGIIMQINNISNPKSLRAGDTIKVINGPFHCRIDRSTFTMDLYLQDTFVKSFVVGLGKPGMETPIGSWVVKSDGKLISPTWTDTDTGKTYDAQDPGYPLGARWIGLEGVQGQAKGRTGFAIHGTENPEQLGTAGSRGCIRVHDEDAKLLYNLLRAGVSQIIISN